MKIYISADIEGIAGITHWNEATKSHSDYPEFRELMSREVVAACEGAIAAGASEILIKDAHGSGRNIIGDSLPECASLIRGWSGHPLGMVQELDETFAALVMIGYHSKAGAADNPLAHTLTGDVSHIEINGRTASEFLLHACAAALFRVPVVFVSGDEGLCEEINHINPAVATLGVSRGVGESTISLAPRESRQRIKTGVEGALRADSAACHLTLPSRFEVEIRYVKPTSAYGGAFYPGAMQVGPHTIRFETDDYFEVLRLLIFTV